MADTEYVEYDGFISDESDFYGEEHVRREFKQLARRTLRPYQPDFPLPSSLMERFRFSSSTPKKKIKLSAASEPQDGGDIEGDRAEHNEDVVNFSKARPELSELASKNKRVLQSGLDGQPHALDSQNLVDLHDVDISSSHNGNGAWRQDESIVEFLHRLPVADPTTATEDGWIWVVAPKIPVLQHQQMQDVDAGGFVAEGSRLLSAFDNLVSNIRRDNGEKAASTALRKITPHRNDLVHDILAAAIKFNLRSGKWMLFPGPGDLPRFWCQVATATAACELGPMAKVATFDPARKATLICVYTHDFSDIDDVQRILSKLVDLDLVRPGASPIYYKCDAYTHLGIESSNERGLRASLFSSQEVLANDTKALKNGPLNRLKRGT